MQGLAGHGFPASLLLVWAGGFEDEDGDCGEGDTEDFEAIEALAIEEVVAGEAGCGVDSEGDDKSGAECEVLVSKKDTEECDAGDPEQP